VTPSPQPQISDEDARRRIRTSLDEGLIVEASAGTGKTSELVERIVAVLAAGAKIEQIVAVTFTHKAAGELKIRVRQKLDKARASAADSAVRNNLERSLARLEEAAIGTIHGFCAQILRERPVEARVDPAFEELNEDQAWRIYDRAFNAWFQRRLNRESPGLTRALARLAWRESWDNSPPLEQLKYAGWSLIDWRDYPAPWRRPPFDRKQCIAYLVAGVLALAGVSAQCERRNDTLLEALMPAVHVAAAIERNESTRPRDYDALESLLLKLQRDLKRNTRKGSGKFAPAVRREEVLRMREVLLERLEEFRIHAGADLAAELQGEMEELKSIYADMKSRAGKLDFVDLLLLARDLVRDDREVREYLQGRFRHIFVDEFQDTDPLQAEILLLLAAGDPAETDWLRASPVPGKLFVVGDPKQSIYKFRRADVMLYRKVCDALTSRGVGRVTLTKSYRSVRPIQQFVNAAFVPEMQAGVPGQADYSPLEQHRPDIGTQPAIIALPAPRPYGSQRVSKEKINACLPDAIGAYIEWLVNKSQWRVWDTEANDWGPIRARDICVLFRRFINMRQDMTRDYVRSLDARNIPHLLVGSKSFHNREEVETVRAALTAIEWPDDELSVFATLRGYLFALRDDLLLRFRHEHGALNPLRTRPKDLAGEYQPLAEALATVAELHRRRNYRPIAETVNALLEATRAHAGFMLRPTGRQVLANVQRICDLARSYEINGGISYRGFVEELAAQAEAAEAPEAPVLEEAADGVRLMTVHTAKGLEFPVVILADMTANLTASEPDRYVDGENKRCAMRLLRCSPWELLDNQQSEMERERAEGVRVAYVAATRARDVLVVPAVGDEEREGWLGPLNKALYPPRDRWRKSGRGWGCPTFRGECTVLQRPLDFRKEEEFSVKPGLHRPMAGDHSVVWWDPACLDLEAPENFGLQQEEILEAEPADRAANSVLDYQNWKRDRDRLNELGAAAQFDIFIPSEVTEAPPVQTEIRTEQVERAANRPTGARFGILVHAILRDAPLTASREEVIALSRLHARLLNSPDEEEAAAVESVCRALAHPLLRRAAAATERHREYPLVYRTASGLLLEGVLDLVFGENGSWMVIDFKTDARDSRYQRQLQWYVYAFSQVTGRAVSGTILQV
jgi:ATP-dependent helicase/nuclease subunit A